jgi:HK97 gp10 family phage protein
MKSDFKILGGDNLEKALASLAPAMEKRVAKGAIRAGAVVIRKEARDNAPVRGGTLRRAIQVVARKGPGALVSVVVRRGRKFRSRRQDAWYAGFVEFGTRYQPARPFMRRALDTKSNEAVKKTGEYIRTRFSKIVAELR